jgi:hypothetical protein
LLSTGIIGKQRNAEQRHCRGRKQAKGVHGFPPKTTILSIANSANTGNCTISPMSAPGHSTEGYWLQRRWMSAMAPIANKVLQRRDWSRTASSRN